MTDEEELLLDCWTQFAYPIKRNGTTEFSHGGLSTLQMLYRYLLDKKLIYENGTPI